MSLLRVALERDDRLEPHAEQLLRRLAKKDVSTKLKALQELQRNLAQRDDAAAYAQSLMQHYVPAYVRLAADESHRVREHAATALAAFVQLLGRQLAPHLRPLAATWLCARHDPQREVRHAAVAAFDAAFPTPTKYADALAFCAASIVDGLSERVLARPPRAGSDADVEAHARSVSSALGAASHTLATLSLKSPLPDAIGSFATALGGDEVWELGRARSSPPAVLAALYTWAGALLEHAHAQLSERLQIRISALLLEGLSERAPSCQNALWGPLLVAMRLGGPVAAAIAASGVERGGVLAKLREILRNRCFGAVTVVTDSLLPLCSLLPDMLVAPLDGLDSLPPAAVLLSAAWEGAADAPRADADALRRTMAEMTLLLLSAAARRPPRCGVLPAQAALMHRAIDICVAGLLRGCLAEKPRAQSAALAASARFFGVLARSSVGIASLEACLPALLRSCEAAISADADAPARLTTLLCATLEEFEGVAGAHSALTRAVGQTWRRMLRRCRAEAVAGCKGGGLPDVLVPLAQSYGVLQLCDSRIGACRRCNLALIPASESSVVVVTQPAGPHGAAVGNMGAAFELADTELLPWLRAEATEELVLGAANSPEGPTPVCEDAHGTSVDTDGGEVDGDALAEDAAASKPRVAGHLCALLLGSLFRIPGAIGQQTSLPRRLWERMLAAAAGRSQARAWMCLSELVSAVDSCLEVSTPASVLACAQLDRLAAEAFAGAIAGDSASEHFFSSCTRVHGLLSGLSASHIFQEVAATVRACEAGDETVAHKAHTAVEMAGALLLGGGGESASPAVISELLLAYTALVVSPRTSGWIRPITPSEGAESGQSAHDTPWASWEGAPSAPPEFEAALLAAATATRAAIDAAPQAAMNAAAHAMASARQVSPMQDLAAAAAIFWPLLAASAFSSTDPATRASLADGLWGSTAAITARLKPGEAWFDAAACWAWLSLAVARVDPSRARAELGVALGPDAWRAASAEGAASLELWRLVALGVALLSASPLAELIPGGDGADNGIIGALATALPLELLDVFYERSATPRALDASDSVLSAADAPRTLPARLARFVLAELLPHLRDGGGGLHVELSRRAMSRSLDGRAIAAPCCTLISILRCTAGGETHASAEDGARSADALFSDLLADAEASRGVYHASLVLDACIQHAFAWASPMLHDSVASLAVERVVSLRVGPSVAARAALARAGELSAEEDAKIAEDASAALHLFAVLSPCMDLCDAERNAALLARMQSLALGVAADAVGNVGDGVRASLCAALGALLPRLGSTALWEPHARWIHAIAEGVLRNTTAEVGRGGARSPGAASAAMSADEAAATSRLNIAASCADIASVLISSRAQQRFREGAAAEADAGVPIEGGDAPSHEFRGARLLQLGLTLVGLHTRRAASLHSAQPALQRFLWHARALLQEELPSAASLAMLAPLVGAVSPTVRSLALTLIARAAAAAARAGDCLIAAGADDTTDATDGAQEAEPLPMSAVLPEGSSLPRLMAGEDAEDADAQLCAWACALHLLSLVSPKVAARLILHLREERQLPSLLRRMLPELTRKPAGVALPPPSVLAACEAAIVARRPPPSGGALAASLYVQLLQRLPSLVRQWWLALPSRGTRAEVERYTEALASPLLLQLETDAISEGMASEPAEAADEEGDSGGGGGDSNGGSFRVRARPKARQIVATNEYENTSMQVVLTLSKIHPLGLVTIECVARAGVTEKQWQRWQRSMSTMLLAQNGSISDALTLWRENVKKVFEGVEECPICYAIVEATTRALPKLTCVTCKNKFHSACIYKWFQSSGKSTCPLCQSTFSNSG